MHCPNVVAIALPGGLEGEAEHVASFRLMPTGPAHTVIVCDLLFHPDALKEVTRSLRLITSKLRASQEANACFLEILTTPKSVERMLRDTMEWMVEAGLLDSVSPSTHSA